MGMIRHYEKFKIICKKCGKEFYVPFYSRNTSKFCSRKCYNEINRRVFQCKKCGKKFIKPKWVKSKCKDPYCSINCYNNREDDIFVNCNGCGKLIKIFPSQKKYYDNHYCSNKCKIRFGPTGKLTEENIVDSNYYRFIRKVRHCKQYYEWRKNVSEKYNCRCYNCGDQSKLTVHHKYVTMYDFVRKYGFNIDAIYSDKMFFDVNNGVLLCRRCHAKEHRKNNCRR